MSKKFLLALLAAAMASASAWALPLRSKHVLVVEEDSGRIILEKRADKTVPIASLTKLMTAMVVLDAQQDMDELVSIEEPEIRTRRRSWSRLPPGTMMPRRDVLQLALMSSDNRAAASLAHAYPGGMEAFVAAVEAKLVALGMDHTTIEEPTGLSAANRSTAVDLVRMTAAAAAYPEIARITTDTSDLVDVNGRTLEYHNTNRLVGREGWGILLSKTGTTSAAGRCLIMRFEEGGKTVILVLLNARAKGARIADAVNIRRFVARRIALAQAEAARHERAAQRDTVTAPARPYPLHLAKADVAGRVAAYR